MDKMKDCPFCGSSNISTISTPNRVTVTSYHIECNNCNARTDNSGFTATVEALWNKRDITKSAEPSIKEVIIDDNKVYKILDDNTIHMYNHLAPINRLKWVELK